MGNDWTAILENGDGGYVLVKKDTDITDRDTPCVVFDGSALCPPERLQSVISHNPTSWDKIDDVGKGDTIAQDILALTHGLDYNGNMVIPVDSE